MDFGFKDKTEAERALGISLISIPLFMLLPKRSTSCRTEGPEILKKIVNEFNNIGESNTAIELVVSDNKEEIATLYLTGLTARMVEVAEAQSIGDFWIYKFTGWFRIKNAVVNNIFYEGFRIQFHPKNEEIFHIIQSIIPNDEFVLGGNAIRRDGRIVNLVFTSVKHDPGFKMSMHKTP